MLLKIDDFHFSYKYSWALSVYSWLTQSVYPSFTLCWILFRILSAAFKENSSVYFHLYLHSFSNLFYIKKHHYVYKYCHPCFQVFTFIEKEGNITPILPLPPWILSPLPLWIIILCWLNRICTHTQTITQIHKKDTPKLTHTKKSYTHKKDKICKPTTKIKS